MGRKFKGRSGFCLLAFLLTSAIIMYDGLFSRWVFRPANVVKVPQDLLSNGDSGTRAVGNRRYVYHAPRSKDEHPRPKAQNGEPLVAEFPLDLLSVVDGKPGVTLQRKGWTQKDRSLQQEQQQGVNQSPQPSPDFDTFLEHKSKQSREQPVDTGSENNKMQTGTGKTNKVVHRTGSDESTQKCTPVLHVAFLKTHKAGSSTITTILQRFGMSWNLTFALPNRRMYENGYNYISIPGQVMDSNCVRPLLPHQTEYNILCHHATYNRTAFRAIMPPQTQYISILREPFSQFVSSFEYYKVVSTLGKVNRTIGDSANPMSLYLQNPSWFERTKTAILFSYIKAKQAEDFGFRRQEFFYPTKARKYIDEIEKDFTLVMIMEFFDESLVLLKHRLCWTTKDILYTVKNQNKFKHEFTFTKADHQHHKKIAFLDYKLYEHFLKVFNDSLAQQSEDFYEEVQDFKQLLVSVDNACAAGTGLNVTGTRWYDSFHLSESDCTLIGLGEIPGLNRLIHAYFEQEAKQGLTTYPSDEKRQHVPILFS